MPREVAYSIVIFVDGVAVTAQRGHVDEADAKDFDHAMNAHVASGLREFFDDLAIAREMEGR